MKWLEYTSIPFTVKSCTGVGSHSLLQGIFPTQGSNRGLPHCRQILYHLSHQESPYMCVYYLHIDTQIYTHTYFGSFCLYVISIPSHIIFPKYFPLQRVFRGVFRQQLPEKRKSECFIKLLWFSSKISVFLNITGPCNYINVVILNPVM